MAVDRPVGDPNASADDGYAIRHGRVSSGGQSNASLEAQMHEIHSDRQLNERGHRLLGALS